MKNLIDFLNYDFKFGNTVHITVKSLILVVLIFILTAILLRLFKKFTTRKLPEEDKQKFKGMVSYISYNKKSYYQEFMNLVLMFFVSKVALSQKQQ